MAPSRRTRSFESKNVLPSFQKPSRPFKFTRWEYRLRCGQVRMCCWPATTTCRATCCTRLSGTRGAASSTATRSRRTRPRRSSKWPAWTWMWVRSLIGPAAAAAVAIIRLLHRDLHLQQARSNASHVLLTSVVAANSGKYGCEASADAPSFHTQIMFKEMMVVGEWQGLFTVLLFASQKPPGACTLTGRRNAGRFNLSYS